MKKYEIAKLVFVLSELLLSAVGLAYVLCSCAGKPFNFSVVIPSLIILLVSAVRVNDFEKKGE
jgi:hypothetical protein